MNIVGMFLNQYFPWWFPTFEFIFFFLYIAGLVLITVWLCNDTKTTRTGLRVAIYLIIGSIVASVIVAIIYVSVLDKQFVMIGTGDKGDSDNYDKQPKSWYLICYIFTGILIIVLAMFYAFTIE